MNADETVLDRIEKRGLKCSVTIKEWRRNDDHNEYSNEHQLKIEDVAGWESPGMRTSWK